MLVSTPVRWLLLLGFVGCQSAYAPDTLGGKGLAGIECRVDSDCALAGAKCCDCPTFAVAATDPAYRACAGVACPASTCPANVRAACELGTCVLACAPMTCASSCGDGYAIDANGCLSCACVQVGQRACTASGDCARVRADCCGCANGGADTAVPIGDVAAHDASLGCPTNPSCPSGDTCAVDLAPACVEGACELTPPLPANACGRADLAACPSTQACTINASRPASAQGVGVCM